MPSLRCGAVLTTELQAVRLGQRFEVRNLHGRIEAVHPDGEVATNPYEARPHPGGQQTAADGDAIVVATGQPTRSTSAPHAGSTRIISP